MISPQRYARIAGLLYLVVIVAGILAELVVRDRIVVARDAAATANNILAHEQFFRWGFAVDLTVLCVMPLILLLYELLKIVNPRVAMLAIFFSLVGSAMQATVLLAHFAPLILLGRGPELGVNLQLLQALTSMTLRLQSIGYSIALSFFGGTMIARGYLVIRSTFLPRFIGVFLAIEGVCYLANSFANFVAPSISGRVFAVLMVSGLAEVILCLWLLVRGVNVSKWQEQMLAGHFSTNGR